MPYKCEKIHIANTQFDKRIKLTDDDKQEIIDKFSKGQSMRSLSREFEVDRQVIKYTLFPQFKEEFYKANRERVKPEISKEIKNEYMKRHRHHKQQLYVDGLIK